MVDYSIKGLLAKHELEILEDIAKTVPKNGVIVEVGSYLGLSASAWAGAADPSVKIYCIDYFYDFESFRKNTTDYKNIIPIRGQSPNAIKYPGDMIDVFFLDAAHENPSDWFNIEYFLPLIKPGGLFIGHDYTDSQYPDVIENVKVLEARLEQAVKLYHNTSLYSFRI